MSRAKKLVLAAVFLTTSTLAAPTYILQRDLNIPNWDAGFTKIGTWTQGSNGVSSTSCGKLIYNVASYNAPLPALFMYLFDAVYAINYSQYFGADLSGNWRVQVRVDSQVPNTVNVLFAFPGGPTVTLASAWTNYPAFLRSVVHADAQGTYWVTVAASGFVVLDVPLPSVSGGINGYVGFGACTSGASAIAHIDIETPETVPPNAIPSGSISATATYNSVSLSWPAATDNTGGSGILEYWILKAGQFIGSTTFLSYNDNAASPSTTTVYTVRVVDRFYNFANTTKSVTTPYITTNPPYPSVLPEGRQVGVRSTGTYWGAGGEKIDVRSGNLNFTIPVVTARSRGGWGVPFALSYNSQNWMYENSTNAHFGGDVGYGYGSRAMRLLPAS